MTTCLKFFFISLSQDGFVCGVLRVGVVARSTACCELGAGDEQIEDGEVEIPLDDTEGVDPLVDCLGDDIRLEKLGDGKEETAFLASKVSKSAKTIS